MKIEKGERKKTTSENEQSEAELNTTEENRQEQENTKYEQTLDDIPTLSACQRDFIDIQGRALLLAAHIKSSVMINKYAVGIKVFSFDSIGHLPRNCFGVGASFEGSLV